MKSHPRSLGAASEIIGRRSWTFRVPTNPPVLSAHQSARASTQARPPVPHPERLCRVPSDPSATLRALSSTLSSRGGVRLLFTWPSSSVSAVVRGSAFRSLSVVEPSSASRAGRQCCMRTSQCTKSAKTALTTSSVMMSDDGTNVLSRITYDQNARNLPIAHHMRGLHRPPTAIITINVASPCGCGKEEQKPVCEEAQKTARDATRPE